MKKMKQVCLLLVLLACVFWPANAFAASDGIGVQLNGKDMNFTEASPMIEDNRVYVPFRTVFEALGATISYDKGADTITAKKDDTTVQFSIGNTDITVNGETVKTDVASIVRNGHTYVPVRFAAQSLDVNVGWDSKTQTVVMLDKAALKEELKGQYTLMDQYMKYSEKFSKEPMAVKGTMKFDMKVADGSGADAAMIPVSGNMTFDGISSSEVSNMKMAAKLELNELQAALEKAGELTTEDKAVMDQIKEFEMEIIANMQTGKVYMKTALFDLTYLDGNTWYEMDLNSLLAGTGMNLQALMESANSGSYEQYMLTMLDTLPVTDAETSKALLETALQYQDKNFEQSGNNYVSTLKQEADGAATTVRMTIKTDGKGKAVGYAQDMSVYMGTTPLMTIKMDQTGNKATFDMTMNMTGVITIDASGDMEYTATNETPQVAPAAGETVIDMIESLNTAA